jgi:dipeptidase E
MSSWSEPSGRPVAADLTAGKPVNLALYSDQIIPDDAGMDQALLDMLKRKRRGRRFGYVPSGPDPDLHFFRDSQAYYAQYEIDLAVYCDLDEPSIDILLQALLDCDAIHLSGGHTGSFLQRLRTSGALKRLRDWALDGGILIGASAGAILMAPTIAADGLFCGRRPEDVHDGEALDLVPFEFFPHLNDSAAYLPDLVRYSLSTPRPIIACRDGEGVIVEQGVPTFIGHPLVIRNGAVTALSAGDGT